MKQSILLISLFITTFTFGQVDYIELDKESMSKRKFFDDISVGISLNHSLLRGDAYGLSDQFINDDVSLNAGDKIDMGFGVRVAKQISRMFDIGIEFNMSNMTGVKEYETNKPYYTRAADIDYTNFNLTSRFYLSKLIFSKARTPKLLGYIDLAGGVLMSEATTINVDEGLPNYVEDKRVDDETSIVYGFGGGIELRVLRKMSVDLGTKILYSNSDKVDGIYVSEFDQTDQNKHDDVFWVSHLGVNFDLSKRTDESVSKKWHLGLLKEETIEEEEIVETAVKVVDTVYINTVDTVVVTRVDTVVKEIKDRTILTPVYFDTESAIVKEDQLAAIEKAAQFLMNNPKTYISLNGFTDERGPEDYNMKLSERRVKAVEKILINIYHIDKSRIKPSYHGENNLKVDQHDLNRRVDLYIK